MKPIAGEQNCRREEGEEMRVLIIGAGGHGQVVADILFRMRDEGSNIALAGFLDDRPEVVGQKIMGVPVLGLISDCARIEHDALMIAIGKNETRGKLFQLLLQDGTYFPVARHPGSIVASDVKVGMGSMLCAGAIVNTGSTIGESVILNTGCTVDHHNRIENFVHIAPGVHLGGDVIVGEGALIGIGATVLPGRRIGAWSIIGAGALVTKDIPERSFAFGTPARIVSNSPL
jgi:sugar O-acyltransferase (sialic acid O-acetyltransferase NeuD family)